MRLFPVSKNGDNNTCLIGLLRQSKEKECEKTFDKAEHVLLVRGFILPLMMWRGGKRYLGSGWGREARDRSIWEKIIMRGLEFVDTEEQRGGRDGRRTGKRRR